MRTTIDAAGRVVIPKLLRARLGLTGRGEVEIEQRDGAVEIRPRSQSVRVRPEELLEHCLAKPGAWQDEPWEGELVAKVHDKIVAFLGSDDGPATSIGLKCGAGRDEADEWLLRYSDAAHVMAYIGRSGWNTLNVGAAIPDDEILEAVDVSYDTVVAKLPKKHRPEAPKENRS